MLVDRNSLRLDFRLAKSLAGVGTTLSGILFTNLDKKKYDDHYMLESISWFSSEGVGTNYPNTYVADVNTHKVYSLIEENHPYDDTRYFLKEMDFTSLPTYIQDAVVKYCMEEGIL